MRSRKLVWVLPFFSAALVGCRPAPVVMASASAAPSVGIAVGPIPGATEPPANKVNPYATDRAALADGRQLFVRYNCAGCHGGRAGGGMGPSLRDQVWIYGGTDLQVFDSIAQGRAHGMPAWGTKISEDQIWRLAAYVKSLRTPLEPDAPQP